ncbi:hypothetical protein [Bacillus spizizenii]|uniref:hypothetical protein n=1 Tax=Bacillus spizizenii TaxID=96241 RepID=UPI002FC5967E
MRITIIGLTEALKSAANAQALKTDVGHDVERGVRRMANGGANNAPKKTGRLANSIVSSPHKEDDLSWSFGSDLPYARRQEYEHRTRKAFIRRAVWDNEDELEKDIERSINDRLGR